jgi:hypothetical protein
MSNLCKNLVVWCIHCPPNKSWMTCLATLDIEDGIELISDCLKTVSQTHATLQWLTHGQQLDATKHNTQLVLKKGLNTTS